MNSQQQCLHNQWPSTSANNLAASLATEGSAHQHAHLLGAQLLEAVAQRAWYMAEARIVGVPKAQACVLDAL